MHVRKYLMARPKKPDDERRTTALPFQIRATEAERSAWDAAAAPEPTSKWAREVLNRAAKRTKKPEAD
jgi:hypothetical protein